MEEIVEVEIRLTKMGPGYYTPTKIEVSKVPVEEYEKLLDLVYEWLTKFTESKQ